VDGKETEGRERAELEVAHRSGYRRWRGVPAVEGGLLVLLHQTPDRGRL
jgi:hypothetical protein